MNENSMKCPRVLKGAVGTCGGTLDAAKPLAGKLIAYRCRRCGFLAKPDDEQLHRQVNEVRR